MLWCGKLITCIFLLPHVVRCFSHCSYRPGQYSTARSVRSSIASCSPFIAVLRNVDRESALEVVHALYEAGFAMVSVTADTPGFEDILRALSSEATFEDLLVGASSVTNPEQVTEIICFCSVLLIELFPHVHPSVHVMRHRWTGSHDTSVVRESCRSCVIFITLAFAHTCACNLSACLVSCGGGLAQYCRHDKIISMIQDY